MRHRKAGRQLGRDSQHRRSLFRNLVSSFLHYERVETTSAKAKEIRSIADRMITLGKRGDLAARRMALSYLQSRDVVAKLFSEIAPRFVSRNGGYTRIIPTRQRRGDGAPMVLLELTETQVVEKKKKAAGEKAKKTAATQEKEKAAAAQG
jgi:large subunit ribosomal protein L17